MTSTSTPKPRSRRWARGAGSLAILAATPKCGLCLMGYLGIGAALGLRSREICGEPPPSPLLLWASAALVVGGIIALCASFRPRGSA